VRGREVRRLDGRARVLRSAADRLRQEQAVPAGPRRTGCGGSGNNLYNIKAFDSTVIRVGLTPSAVWQVFHATSPNQGCFDDREGDDSVDFAFYEALYDRLAATLCFDRRRVFAAGNSTGATLANELGCKYAGDAKRPVRGIMVKSGGLPSDPSGKPTCTTAPMAGMWIHQVGDTAFPFTGNIFAMNRALNVDGCTPPGVSYATAMFDPFPLSSDTTSCKKYRGCPESSPMIVCPVAGSARDPAANLVPTAWPAFVALFDALP
jgi:hypothetical protein